MPRERYDSSDETLYKPVSVDEVDRLMGARGRPISDRYNLQHFLYRVRLTLYTADEATKELRRALEEAAEKKRRHGTPTTLSPLDAVKFASPEELSIIVGNISSSQLRALASQVDTARALREDLAATLGQVRAAAQTIAARADIPATVRADFVDLLNTLPATPAEVAVPKALELAEMAGLLDEPTPAGPPALPAGPAAPAPGQTSPDPAGTPLAITATTSPAPVADADAARTVAPVADLPCYGPPPVWQPGPGLQRTDKEHA